MRDSAVRELRAVQRYKVRLPVRLMLRAPGRNSCVNAMTRDISTRGMFVTTNARVGDGDLLGFELDLALDEATPLIVQGTGRIVRIEGGAGQSAGFAVHNASCRFREMDPGGALPLDRHTFDGAPLPAPIRVLKAGRHRGLAIVPRSDWGRGDSR